MNMLLVKAVLALCLTRCLLAEEYWSESDRFAKNLNHFIDESIHRNELQVTTKLFMIYCSLIHIIDR